MKFEIEILESDLKDRDILREMRALLENSIQKLSAFARNGLVGELEELRSNIKWLDNWWLKTQRECLFNNFTQAVNEGKNSV